MKVFKQKTKKIMIFFLISQFVFFQFPLPKAIAATGSQTLTSQSDFQAGTADANTEINLTPGDIKLKENKNMYTETTKAEFDLGHSPVDSFNQSAVSETDNGEVIINQGYAYNTETNPAIGDNDVYHSFLDSAHNLLYVSTYVGLSVINTQGTIDPADDTLVKTYTTATTPAIGHNYVYHSFLDSAHNLLYISTSGGGLSVINTQGTIDPADDTLVKTYTTATTPAIGSNYVYHSFLDSAYNLLYISTSGGGLSVINLNQYNSFGTRISQPLEVSDTPTGVISFSPTLPEGSTVSMQTRTGDAEAVWIDNFNDGDASNVSDYYDYGYLFNSVFESNDILTMADPAENWGTYMYLNTGEEEDFFPAGSRITAKMRYIGENATNVQIALGSDDRESFSMNFNLPVNEWVYPAFTSMTPFSIVEIDNYWDDGTWNSSTDKIEIDWVKIEFPDEYWDDWTSECTNQYGCEVADTTDKTYLQYKLNLSTEDTSVTPVVNSITLASGYADSGVYTSDVIDATRTADWQDLDIDSTMPTNTSITYQTRSGRTATPDGTWSGWADVTDNNINSPDARYLQLKATLATTDETVTPVISSITVNYDTVDLREIEDPDVPKMSDEYSQGFITIAGADPTNTESFTLNANYIFSNNNNTLEIPAGTVVTQTGGGNLDLTQFTTEDNTLEIKAENGDTLGSIRIGIPNLRLTFSSPITVSIYVGEEYNGNELSVFYRLENDTNWNSETTCTVSNGLCTFQTTHTTTFRADGSEEEATNAHIDSWTAEQYTNPNTKCTNRLKLTIKGKHFDKNATVKIGNKEASSVEKKDKNKLVAKFCLDKLLNIKTDLERNITVTNPDADKKKAKKEINLSDFTNNPNTANTNNSSEYIKSIQRKLVELNLLEERYITGFYGPITTEAVRKFQEQNGIQQTGSLGPETKSKLLGG